MGPSKPIVLTVVRFCILLGLLIFPWPGWNELYAGYFRSLGQAVFSRQDDQRIVNFRPCHEKHGYASLDTQLTLSNRVLVDGNGKAPAEEISLDTRSIGWMPTALTVALILATPLPWRQRAWALAWGLLLIHLFILLSLQVWIWDESPALSLTNRSPFSQRIMDELEYALLTQMGASFSVPVLIWILVAIRRENLLGESSSGAGE